MEKSDIGRLGNKPPTNAYIKIKQKIPSQTSFLSSKAVRKKKEYNAYHNST